MISRDPCRIRRGPSAVCSEQSNSRLHADERLRGAYGAPPSLAGEPNVVMSSVYSG